MLALYSDGADDDPTCVWLQGVQVRPVVVVQERRTKSALQVRRVCGHGAPLQCRKGSTALPTSA